MYPKQSVHNVMQILTASLMSSWFFVLRKNMCSPLASDVYPPSRFWNVCPDRNIQGTRAIHAIPTAQLKIKPMIQTFRVLCALSKAGGASCLLVVGYNESRGGSGGRGLLCKGTESSVLLLYAVVIVSVALTDMYIWFLASMITIFRINVFNRSQCEIDQLQ